MKQEERNYVISLEEQNSRNKRDETIKESMKQQDVTVPDALKPEHIQHRLQQMDSREYENRKRHFQSKRIGKIWAAAAAGIVLLATAAVGGGMLTHQNQKKSDMYKESAIHSEQTTETYTVAEPEPDTLNDTYREAYEVLEECQQLYDSLSGECDDSEYETYDDYDAKEYEEDTRTLGDIINGVVDSFTNKKYSDKSMESQGETNASGVEDDSSVVAESAAPAGDKEYSESNMSADEIEEYSKNNVRTEGVEECNIVRTDGRYIYEYDESSSYINIYNAKGADTSLLGEINLNEYAMEVTDGFYVADGTLTISGTVYQDSAEEKGSTRTLIYDIKNPEEPKFLKGFSQDGIYKESRMVGDIVYVFSSYRALDRQIEKLKPATYIPKFEGEMVSERDLYIQQDCYIDSYTMISGINVMDCIYVDKKAILGGTGKYYVSSSHIYLMDMSYAADNDIRLLRLTYKDGKLSDKTNGKMKGEINDDYSIDEYQGYLRMVTHYYDEKRYDYVNGLFIYDEDLKQVGSVKGIAEGEDVKSVRFIKDTAYFVTYRNTDPLFAVDISNPKKPKILGYLKIPGFSTYLHPYGDNLLFGLGLETDEDSNVLGLKLSMYDISKPSKIKEIDKLVLTEYENSEALYDANALLIDPDKNLIGFAAEKEQYDDTGDEFWMIQDYLVYSYDKKQGFVRRLRQSDDLNDYDYYEAKTRGLYINDYFYVVTVGEHIKTYKMKKDSFERLKK